MHWLNRELLAHQFVQKPHASHQTGIHLVGFRLATEDLLTVVLDSPVLHLEDAVAPAQQVEDESQPVIAARRLEQDQEVSRVRRVLVQVSLQLAEASGVAAEANRSYLTPSVRTALGIEHRQRTRSRHVLAIANVDAHIDPLLSGRCLRAIARRSDGGHGQVLSPPFYLDSTCSRPTTRPSKKGGQPSSGTAVEQKGT